MKDLEITEFMSGTVQDFQPGAFTNLEKLEYLDFDMNIPKILDFAFEFVKESNMTLTVKFSGKDSKPRFSSEKVFLKTKRRTILIFNEHVIDL